MKFVSCVHGQARDRPHRRVDRNEHKGLLNTSALVVDVFFRHPLLSPNPLCDLIQKCSKELRDARIVSRLGFLRRASTFFTFTILVFNPFILCLPLCSVCFVLQSQTQS